MTSLTAPSPIEPAPRPRPADRAPAAAPRARAAWPWAVLAFALCAAAFVVHVVRWKGGDVSGTYYVVEKSYRELALHDVYPPGRIRLQDGPYDGAFFLALANDPLLLDYTDETRFHRGRRILLPWCAWLLGAGQPEAILYTIPLATLLLVGLGTWALARLLIENGRHPAWSLLNAVTLGTAVSLLRGLADAAAVNLLLVAVWAWQNRRARVAILFFTLAALAKEVMLLAPATLGAWLVWKERAWRRALPLAIAPAVLISWWAYVAVGSESYKLGRSVGLPLAGIYRVIFLPNPRGTGWELETLPPMLFACAVALAPLVTRGPWDTWRRVTCAFGLLAALGVRDLWEEYWGHARAFIMIPAFLLVGYATTGRKWDLAGAIAVGAAGAFVWGFWL